jgi:hypothetical protein
MIYSIPIIVPANTQSNRPVEADVQINEEVITHVRVRFPPGPSCMVRTALYYGQSQILPQPPDTYLAGDDETIEWDEFIILPSSPCRLTIRAWSPGTMYDHVIFWYIVALPEEIARWWSHLETFTYSFEKFLKTLKITTK